MSYDFPNSDLQAGIWFGSVAVGPIISFPHFTVVWSSLPKNVIFSAHMLMRNAAYISSIMWNSISGLDSSYDFQFGVSCAVAVKVRSCKYFFQVIYCNPMKGCLPSNVVFRQRTSSIKGRLLSKVVFRQRSSFVKSCLPSKVLFRQRSSSVKGRLPSKVVFRQRSPSVKCNFHFWVLVLSVA